MSGPTTCRREEFEVYDSTHGSLLATALVPPGHEGRVCLFLYGGGGNPHNLFDIAPIAEAGFADGTIPAMVVACLGVPPWCFYLDDPARGMAWESAVAERFLNHIRERFDVSGPIGLVGVSMGGYGALKIALGRPETYAAVAAVAPMVEPTVHADATPLRNRFHYPPECPAALVGPQRDADLFRRDHPAHRATEHAEAIASHDLAIRLDAGSRDAVHAHDGAEALHRVLWDLDLRHEYHLHQDADHVGPTLLPRLHAAFSWVGQRLDDSMPLSPSPEERALADALAPGTQAGRSRGPFREPHLRRPPARDGDLKPARHRASPST